LPHFRDKALAVHPHQKGPSTCSVILCNRIKITISVEFDNQGQSLLHITIKCTCSVWCNYERRPCEEKTVHNCETSGYSTNTASWKQWL